MKVGGTTIHALLGLLSFHPMSGYDMRQLIPESIGHFWSESYGQIYPALRRMTAEGLVEKATEQAEGRPRRHVYSLTDSGRKQLERWLEVPVGPPVPRNEMLLKVFFGAHAGLRVTRERVQACLEGNSAAMQTYASVVERLKENEVDDPQLPFWLMTLSYGRHVCGATVAWCEETLRELDQMEGLV